jgi:hypothetical protein
VTAYVVWLTPEAGAALEVAMVESDRDYSDTICRALVVYAEIVGARRGTTFDVAPPAGEPRTVTVR